MNLWLNDSPSTMLVIVVMRTPVYSGCRRSLVLLIVHDALQLCDNGIEKLRLHTGQNLFSQELRSAFSNFLFQRFQFHDNSLSTLLVQLLPESRGKPVTFRLLDRRRFFIGRFFVLSLLISKKVRCLRFFVIGSRCSTEQPREMTVRVDDV
ncbi:hypothetical protein D477_017944 [Arthrobacter crystallopoietes BAB-32]|uniref:Uncharacterized protein n=1 Tax=Arthrobacter crystallopoietes BAB-32 TaxID=1246476 RepID=N1UR23_9MICC|nr:hypothetical protein D477_017944 [Arthrobacter crystallopoietes BAB-32]